MLFLITLYRCKVACNISVHFPQCNLYKFESPDSNSKNDFFHVLFLSKEFSSKLKCGPPWNSPGHKLYISLLIWHHLSAVWVQSNLWFHRRYLLIFFHWGPFKQLLVHFWSTIFFMQDHARNIPFKFPLKMVQWFQKNVLLYSSWSYIKLCPVMEVILDLWATKKWRSQPYPGDIFTWITL